MNDNEEPMPTSSQESRPVQADALENFTRTFTEQWQKGKAKYGTDLMTHNGRNAGNDAMQEAADLVAYIQQMAMELDDAKRELATLKQANAAEYSQDAAVGRALRDAPLLFELSYNDDWWYLVYDRGDEVVHYTGSTAYAALAAAGLMEEEGK